MKQKIIAFSSFWIVSDKATLRPSFTCHEEQGDGTCGSVHIPNCVDRTVRCETLPNPNSVDTNNGCDGCPAAREYVGNVPNLNDLREMDTGLR